MPDRPGELDRGLSVHASEQSNDLSMLTGPGHGIPQADVVKIDVAKLDRAVADLHADFRRQNGRLKQAQFDRLVLRRNFSPPEMVALTQKLGALGVVADGFTSNRSERNGAAAA